MRTLPRFLTPLTTISDPPRHYFRGPSPTLETPSFSGHSDERTPTDGAPDEGGTRRKAGSPAPPTVETNRMPRGQTCSAEGEPELVPRSLLLGIFILQRAHSLDELIPLFPDKSPRCVGKKFREVLQFESSRRPWTRDEDHQLLVWVAGHGKRWKEAEVQFRWRSEGHLRERYNALLAQQH